METISFWTKQFLKKNNISFYFKEEAGSSNDWAKEEAFKTLSSPTVFLVSHQNQGRGYGNKKWKDSDLMLSILWEEKFSDISLKVCGDFAVDLKQALQNTWPQLEFKVKAPNDLYLEREKLSGLLLEVLKQGSQTALIVGLGLNVFSAPKDLRATYLAKYTQEINLQIWQSFLGDLIFYWSQRVKKL
ncbi:MAG: hypothetical protein OXN83_02595 [Oligoflexia bacterium]|nr:hypothetical protein [Oligoflexia bacterium]